MQATNNTKEKEEERKEYIQWKEWKKSNEGRGPNQALRVQKASTRAVDFWKGEGRVWGRREAEWKGQKRVGSGVYIEKGKRDGAKAPGGLKGT